MLTPQVYSISAYILHAYLHFTHKENTIFHHRRTKFCFVGHHIAPIKNVGFKAVVLNRG